MRPTIFDAVSTPAQLEKRVRAVKDGHYQSLIIVGRGGTGKSSVVQDVLPDGVGAFWKSGRISPIQFYQHLYDNRDQTIVLDDAPDIANDLALAGILRQLCETRPRRTISWDTQNRAIASGQVPSSFQTTSKFILITNKWMDRHEEVAALETRCQLVKYEPSVSMLHERAVKLPGVEGAVADYIGAAVAAGRVHQINYRDYLTASDTLRAGIDEWKGILEQKFLPDSVEDLDSDAEAVRALFLQSGKKELTTRDLTMGPRRFRGQTALVNDILEEMVGRGMLVASAAPRQAGKAGRPPSKRYALAAPAGMGHQLAMVG